MKGLTPLAAVLSRHPLLYTAVGTHKLQTSEIRSTYAFPPPHITVK